jgi:ribosomal protein L25 (general stress protein Ctc)
MSPTSPSPASPQSEGPERVSRRELRRQNTVRRWKKAGTIAAVMVGMGVADVAFDVHGRVERAFQNRPALLTKLISAEFDTPFTHERMDENIAYYEQL